MRNYIRNRRARQYPDSPYYGNQYNVSPYYATPYHEYPVYDRPRYGRRSSAMQVLRTAKIFKSLFK